MKAKPWVVVEYLVENNLKRSALADKAGICVETLNRAINGKNIAQDSIYRIAKAMGVKPQDLL